MVNTVLRSNFWHTLLKPSFNPETFGKQIVYFNVSSSSLIPLGLYVNLIMYAGHTQVEQLLLKIRCVTTDIGQCSVDIQFLIYFLSVGSH